MSAPTMRGQCVHCGKPLSGEHDGWAHSACQKGVTSDDKAAAIRDDRELGVVEADLVSRRRCCWQLKPSSWDGTAVYCDRGTDGARFCPEHQAEADRDHATATTRADRTTQLLAARPGRAAPPLNGAGMTAITGEVVTHRAWNAWAQNAVGGLEALAASLDVMTATIAADNGDQAQIAAIRGWQARILDVAAAGRRMVADVNARQVPVGEAVAAGGGPENTPNPEYADEAR
jgi:hypothetical protein